MRRFIIIGAILASAALCVLLAQQGAFTQTKTSEKMIITVSTRTGEVLITNEKGEKPALMSAGEFKKIGETLGFKHVGVILHYKTSPGCTVYCSGGWCWEFCSP